MRMNPFTIMLTTIVLIGAASHSSPASQSQGSGRPSGALQQPGVNADLLTGKTFFPQLITEPFHSGLSVVFIAAAVMMLIGAIASLFNPGKYADAPGADNNA